MSNSLIGRKAVCSTLSGAALRYFTTRLVGVGLASRTVTSAGVGEAPAVGAADGVLDAAGASAGGAEAVVGAGDAIWPGDAVELGEAAPASA